MHDTSTSRRAVWFMRDISTSGQIVGFVLSLTGDDTADRIRRRIGWSEPTPRSRHGPGPGNTPP